jgi:hypothetical protein
VIGVIELVLILGVTVGIVMLLRGWMANRARRGGWRLEERSDAGAVRLLAVRAGDAPLELGSVPVAEADFDSRLYELRAEAREKLVALNARP